MDKGLTIEEVLQRTAKEKERGRAVLATRKEHIAKFSQPVDDPMVPKKGVVRRPLTTDSEFRHTIKTRLHMSLVNAWGFYAKLANLGIKRTEFLASCVKAFLEDDPDFITFFKEYILKKKGIYSKPQEERLKSESKWSIFDTTKHLNTQRTYDQVLTLPEEELLNGHDRMCKELYYDGEDEGTV